MRADRPPRDTPLHRLPAFAAAAFAAALLAAPAAHGQSYLAKPQTIGGNPGPAHNYVCPNADGKPALECFYDATRHLYTMCRHVKSIEIIEFGYDKAQQGTNGAKSEYCVDKQKQNMWRVYQAALKESFPSSDASKLITNLHEFWLDSLAKLRYVAGETDDEYKARTTKVYEVIEIRVNDIKSAMAAANERALAKQGKKPAP
jgi:hypothetical protein